MLIITFSQSVVWQVLLAVAVSLALFTIMGLVYPFASWRERSSEAVDSHEILSPDGGIFAQGVDSEDGKTLATFLIAAYLDLRFRFTKNYLVPMQPGETEREILNRLLRSGAGLHSEALMGIYRIYERSRFSNMTVDEEELKKAILLANELHRKVP